METEVKEVEQLIKKQYPQAKYIELEPDSRIVSKPGSYAIDDGLDKSLRKQEIETLNTFQKRFKK